MIIRLYTFRFKKPLDINGGLANAYGGYIDEIIPTEDSFLLKISVQGLFPVTVDFKNIVDFNTVEYLKHVFNATEEKHPDPLGTLLLTDSSAVITSWDIARAIKILNGVGQEGNVTIIPENGFNWIKLAVHLFV